MRISKTYFIVVKVVNAMSDAAQPPTITIPLARFKELEGLETNVVNKKTAEEYDAERFRILRERDKADPSRITKRTKKHYERHKDEINAHMWIGVGVTTFGHELQSVLDVK